MFIKFFMFNRAFGVHEKKVNSSSWIFDQLASRENDTRAISIGESGCAR